MTNTENLVYANCVHCGNPPKAYENNVPGNWYSHLYCFDDDCTENPEIETCGDLEDAAKAWNSLMRLHANPKLRTASEAYKRYERSFREFSRQVPKMTFAHAGSFLNDDYKSLADIHKTIDDARDEFLTTVKSFTSEEREIFFSDELSLHIANVSKSV